MQLLIHVTVWPWKWRLSYWGQVPHEFIIKLGHRCFSYGFWPVRSQARTNADWLPVEPLGINFSEFLIKIHFSYNKMIEMLFPNWRPFCLCLNVFILIPLPTCHHWQSWHYDKSWFSVDMDLIQDVSVTKVARPSTLVTNVDMFSPWWRHQMETFSALLAICAGNSPVPGEFPAQRPVTRSFDVSFDLRQNKRLSKQSWGWWIETQLRPLWRQCNVSSFFCTQ